MTCQFGQDCHCTSVWLTVLRKLIPKLLFKNRDGWGIETKDADQITRVFQWINTACLCFSADVFNPDPN